MSEHRKFVRWRVERNVRLKIEEAVDEVFCQLKDINYKGASVALGMKLPEDTGLKINLRLSEGCVIDAEVWIAWHKVFNGVNHYGFYFNKIRDADKDKIYNFIKINYPEDLKQKWWPGKVDKFEGGENMDDHRIFERFSIHFPARLLNQDSGTEALADTFDISAKGVGLQTSRALKPRSNVELWLDVPDKGEPLYTRGQVVWSAPAESNTFRSGIVLERADLMGISRFLRA